MIISEKQIMQLILIGHQYIRILNELPSLSECGKHNLNAANILLDEIQSQQSEKLFEVKDAD